MASRGRRTGIGLGLLAGGPGRVPQGAGDRHLPSRVRGPRLRPRSRRRQGAPIQGYYLLTPMKLASGAVVMVNRGFVPTDLRDPARRPRACLMGR